jgi:hypothetical protein
MRGDDVAEIICQAVRHGEHITRAVGGRYEKVVRPPGGFDPRGSIALRVERGAAE